MMKVRNISLGLGVLTIFSSVGALACLGDENRNHAFKEMDKDNNSLITREEYIGYWNPEMDSLAHDMQQKRRDYSNSRFDVIDANHNGEIGWEERSNLPLTQKCGPT